MTDLRTAEQKFSDVLEVAPDAMVIVDAADKVVIVNSQTESLFGYLRSEMIGEGIQMLVPGQSNGHPMQLPHFFTCRDAPSLDLYGRHKNGTEFPIEIRLSNVETSEGVLVCGAIRDVTERKKHELVLKSSNEELKVAVTELDAFCYSVAHDLRAPLRAMEGFSLILMRQSPPASDIETRAYLQAIRDNAVQMGHLIDDLLSFSGVGRTQLTKVTVPAAPLVDQALRDVRQLAPERSVNVTVGKLPDIWGDPVLFKQVFANLIDNAFKYTRSRRDAEIEIGAQERDGEQVFFVRDNGVGFDMKYAGKLFGVFQRLHRAEDFEGTGVGLAIVQRIINRHGMRVWAEAEQDKGATFFFTTETVPLAQST
jgi:PAS domain S-box-containing protein